MPRLTRRESALAWNANAPLGQDVFGLVQDGGPNVHHLRRFRGTERSTNSFTAIFGRDLCFYVTLFQSGQASADHRALRFVQVAAVQIFGDHVLNYVAVFRPLFKAGLALRFGAGAESVATIQDLAVESDDGLAKTMLSNVFNKRLKFGAFDKGEKFCGGMGFQRGLQCFDGADYFTPYEITQARISHRMKFIFGP